MTLRICEIRSRPVVVPMRRPLRTGGGAVTEAPLLLIDLLTEEGISGRSYLFGYTRFTLKPLHDLVQGLAGMILGDALAPVAIKRKLSSRTKLLGPHGLLGMALSGIDMACWDALATSVGLPLVEFLGGSIQNVPAYNSTGLGIMPPDEAAAEAAELIAEGFRAVKIRLGRPNSSDDLAALRAVRGVLPADGVMMADFNQSLTVVEAIRRGRELEAEQLLWIEEPVRTDDFEGCAEVALALATPISIGESFSSVFQMQDALTRKACDYVMPDVQRIGGVSGWLRASALASAFGVEMSSHIFPEFSAHLLAVTPTGHWLEYMDLANPILLQPYEIRNGTLAIPDRPGVALAWDEAAVDRFLLE